MSSTCHTMNVVVEKHFPYWIRDTFTYQNGNRISEKILHFNAFTKLSFDYRHHHHHSVSKSPSNFQLLHPSCLVISIWNCVLFDNVYLCFFLIYFSHVLNCHFSQRWNVQLIQSQSVSMNEGSINLLSKLKLSSPRCTFRQL